MNYLMIATEIEFDIQTGVYRDFDSLAKKLGHIASKMSEAAFVINSSKELTMGEIKTLKDCGYLPAENKL